MASMLGFLIKFSCCFFLQYKQRDVLTIFRRESTANSDNSIPKMMLLHKFKFE